MNLLFMRLYSLSSPTIYICFCNYFPTSLCRPSSICLSLINLQTIFQRLQTHITDQCSDELKTSKTFPKLRFLTFSSLPLSHHQTFPCKQPPKRLQI
ncbi:hypothetical protein NC653_019137 [Populus alba x Populus x berolinensis]|uniref:Uncharacterized protein n=1 Tax=Populus alba x Populus x berolinensis TaxID=444605 RepID=A0AAD6MMF0_9ROSI|nr:hypothetical protein NC653_024531 [Populus alba x Populus x berolinensis]KAJ6988249.1 hypothetical protein NC653_021242 [Populus alba x Populus x berolinensis]KAJ6990787.1 hypothetical protein NC653_019137 [Populus alba x Populus x berolinensis]